jgi:hypothetical protein
MEWATKRSRILTIGAAMMLCCIPLPILSIPQPDLLIQEQHEEPPKTPAEARAVKRFQEQVKEYVKLRERLERKLPNLSNEAKPDEIEAHKKAFEGIVRSARTTAKPGDAFTPDMANYIRNTIKTEFKGTDRKDLRETILEADTKGVPLRVNYPYPETKEQAQIPPTLLLKLPELPKQVKYRFVGRHLLLVDRENGLIVDYMKNALP